MNYKTIGFGLGAFAAAAAAWTALAATFGPGPRDDTAASGDDFAGPVTPRPAAPATGMAVAETHVEGDAAPTAGHVPTDLMGDAHPGNDSRAVEAFRPDPTAIPTEGEKEALRPATGPASTLVADRGSGFGEAAGAA